MRLNWGTVNERYFEAGVDRGVLYLPNAAGVPWNGLTAVDESPSGGEPRPYYLDGIKYLNLASAEEFEATIEAISSPREFGVCDGTVSIQNGLMLTQQPRSQFGLSYRTLVGNDVDGTDHAYKIHVVYNALAAPGQRSHATLTDTPEPTALSWDISTTPPRVPGYRPTAHMVIDSRTTPEALLAEVEDILYGSDTSISSLPTAVELVALFTA